MASKKISINDFDKSTKTYMTEIAECNPLSKNEERKLWKKYKNNGDLMAREKLITSNLRFVAQIANHYRGRGLSYSDLIEEGNMGLIKAIDYFDYRKDNKIISYSVWWIKQTIIEALEKRNLFVGDYTPEELDIQKDNKIVVNSVEESTEETVKENKNVLKTSLNILNNRERAMIEMYYGLNGDLPCTLEEIGNEYGITKERVRQINEKSLKKLRAHLLCETY